MRIIKIIILISLALYLAGLLFIYTQQRKLMYFPPANYLEPPEVGLPEMTVHGFSSPFAKKNLPGDGGFVAWSSLQVNGKPTVMFFHGNGSAIYSNHDIYRDFMDNGYGVWAVGYPGYPPSNVQPSEEALVRAAQLQYDKLIEQGIAPEEIVFYGTSLGAGVAAQLSKTRKPSLIIMEAPFTSALDIARSQMKIYPVSLLMKDKFLSEEAIKGSGIEMLWLHGTNDTIISKDMGQTLYDNYDGPKTAHIIQGGGHNNLWFMGGREIVLEALASQ